MTELVGVLSAITALVHTGYTVAKTLSDLADDIGTAQHQIDLVATDTKVVCRILLELKIRLKNTKQLKEDIMTHAQAIVVLSEKVILDIQECLLPIIPQINKGLDIIRRARWLFAKSKITTKRACLDSLKLTLNLFLHTVDFSRGDALEEEVIVEVENLVARTKQTKLSFLTAEILDQGMEHACSQPLAEELEKVNQTHQTSESGLPSSGFQDGLYYAVEPYNWVSFIDNSINLSDTSVALPNLARKLKQRNISVFDVIQIISDEQFLKIAEHITLQKTIANLALITLSSPVDVFEDAKTISYQEIGEETPDQNLGTQNERKTEQKAAEGQSFLGSEARTGERRPSVERTDEKQSHFPRGTSNRPLQDSGKQYGTDNSGSNIFAEQANRDIDQEGGSSHGQINDSHQRSPQPNVREPREPESGSWRDHSRNPYADGYSDGRFNDSRRWPSGYGQSPYNVSPQYYPSNYAPFISRPPNPDAYNTSFMPNHELNPLMPEPDPEKEAMRLELEKIKAEQAIKEAEAEQKKVEMRIREEAEAAFRRQLQERDREERTRAEERAIALTKAKKEIEEARREADRATREAVEAERKAPEERELKEQEAIAKAERAVRARLEDVESHVGNKKRGRFLKLFS